MPFKIGSIRCGDTTFEFKRGESGVDELNWLDVPGHGGGFGGVAKRIPLGVWLQDPSKTIWDFIKKVNGKLPDDALDWQVDEDKYRKYVQLFGPRGMLFSKTETACEMPAQMGITREEWMNEFKEIGPAGEEFKPDPVILLAVARKHWVDGGGVVVHGRNGESFRIGGKIEIPGGGVKIGDTTLTDPRDLDKYFEDLKNK